MDSLVFYIHVCVYLRVSFGMKNCSRMSNQPARDSPFIINNCNVNSICMYTHIHRFSARHFNKVGDPRYATREKLVLTSSVVWFFFKSNVNYWYEIFYYYYFNVEHNKNLSVLALFQNQTYNTYFTYEPCRREHVH